MQAAPEARPVESLRLNNHSVTAGGASGSGSSARAPGRFEPGATAAPATADLVFTGPATAGGVPGPAATAAATAAAPAPVMSETAAEAPGAPGAVKKRDVAACAREKVRSGSGVKLPLPDVCGFVAPINQSANGQGSSKTLHSWCLLTCADREV